MTLNLDQFLKVRPRLYHLTARSNWAAIQAAGALLPAAALLRRAGLDGQIGVRRRAHLPLTFEHGSAVLRDQSPLHRGNCNLMGGWEFATLVAELNERVFFWPGTNRGPIDYGRRHFGRYISEDNVVIVVATADILAANPLVGAEFCSYNSGSPRCNGGLASPRGPRTFLTAPDFDGTPSIVKEVTFRGPLALPMASIEVTRPSRWLER